MDVALIRLPCPRVFPLGIAYLATAIHRRKPDLKIGIVDLALTTSENCKRQLQNVLNQKPKHILLSWRDIQILSPNEFDPSLANVMLWWYGKGLEKWKAGMESWKAYRAYQDLLKQNLSLIEYMAKERSLILGGPAANVFGLWLKQLLPANVKIMRPQQESLIIQQITGTSNPVSIDELTFDLSWLLSIWPEGEKYAKSVIGIRTKQGCTKGCIFCVYPFLERTTDYKSRSIIVDEIRQSVKHLSASTFWFADAQSLDTQKCHEEFTDLLKRIKKLKIGWSGYLRWDNITPDLAQIMVASGMNDIEVSIASGSQQVVDRMNIQLDLKKTLKGLALVKKAGFKNRFYVNLSFNAPGETKETIKETVRWWKRAQKTISKEQLVPVIFFIGIQPHTKFVGMLQENGYLPQNWNPLSLNPLTAKKLLYNPGSLGRELGQLFAEVAGQNRTNRGQAFMQRLEAMT